MYRKNKMFGKCIWGKKYIILVNNNYFLNPPPAFLTKVITYLDICSQYLYYHFQLINIF